MDSVLDSCYSDSGPTYNGGEIFCLDSAVGTTRLQDRYQTQPTQCISRTARVIQTEISCGAPTQQ